MKRPNESTRERQDRLAQIRREVATGAYETPERLSAAVDELLADLEGRVNSADAPPRRPK